MINKNTLKPGDKIIVGAGHHRLSEGEVVIFLKDYHTDMALVRRLIPEPDDAIEGMPLNYARMLPYSPVEPTIKLYPITF